MTQTAIKKSFFTTRLINNVELLILLVNKELKLRYANSILGYLWTLIIPLAFITTYYVAFKVVMKIPRPNYIPFLAIGIFPWLWMVNGIVQSTPVFRNNLSLVKKVNLHRAILPLSIVSKEMLHFIFALPIIILFTIFGEHVYYLSWLWLVPFMILVQLFFVYGIALLISVCHVFIRDIEHLISIIMNIIFFMTPVIYPLELVPDRYKIFFKLNPFASFIETWRNIWLTGSLGNNYSFLLCLLYMVIISSIAWFTYKKLGKLIGELL